MKKFISIVVIVIICIFFFLIFYNYKEDVNNEVVSEDYEEITYKAVDLLSQTFEINTDISPMIGYISHPFAVPRGDFYSYYVDDVDKLYANMQTRENIISFEDDKLYYNDIKVGNLCVDCTLGFQDSFYDYTIDDIRYILDVEEEDIDNYLIFSLNKRRVYNEFSGEYINYGGQVSIFQYEDKIYLYINDEADIVFELTIK